MSFNLRKIVDAYLVKNPNSKFTARQIAEYILKNFPAECKRKREASTASVTPIDSDNALIQQFVAEIGSRRPILQKTNPKIKVTDSRPRLYYYSTKTDDDEIQEVEKPLPSQTNDLVLKEHNLYPMLTMYLSSEFGIYTKRIDEKTSSNSHGTRGNHWLFPDVVAMENLSDGWHSEITKTAKAYFSKFTRLWSFEVKIKLNRSNIRESFFQAVSNSSWANFGYLVASEIDDNALKELRILSGLHGIGFIKLDINNPPESLLMIPAKEKLDIDWNTANRLATENKDFEKYMKNIHQFHSIGEIKASDWDKVTV